MTDVILSLLVAVLLGFIYLKDKEHNAQVNKLIKAVISHNAQEFRDITLADNTSLNMDRQNIPIPDDMYATVGDSDADLFDRAIDHELNPDEEDQ